MLSASSAVRLLVGLPAKLLIFPHIPCVKSCTSSLLVIPHRHCHWPSRSTHHAYVSLSHKSDRDHSRTYAIALCYLACQELNLLEVQGFAIDICFSEAESLKTYSAETSYAILVVNSHHLHPLCQTRRCTVVRSILPLLLHSDMLDTDCIHGKSRHLCQHCNLQFSQDLFKHMGAHLDEVSSANDSRENATNHADQQQGMFDSGTHAVFGEELY